MRKLSIKLVGISLIILLSQACGETFENRSLIDQDRLKISRDEFITLISDPTNYDSFKAIKDTYGNSYTPRVSLMKSHTVKCVTKSGITERNEIDKNRSFDFLFNRNNVFQFDQYVIFTNNERTNCKLMFASDYDKFIASNPTNVFDIPQNIVLAETIAKEPSIPPLKTRSEGEPSADLIASCSWCFLAGVASACTGGVAGLVDIAMCIKCYYELRKYYGC